MEFGLLQSLIEGECLFAFVLYDLDHFSHLHASHVHASFPKKHINKSGISSIVCSIHLWKEKLFHKILFLVSRIPIVELTFLVP